MSWASGHRDPTSIRTPLPINRMKNSVVMDRIWRMYSIGIWRDIRDVLGNGLDRIEMIGMQSDTVMSSHRI